MLIILHILLLSVVSCVSLQFLLIYVKKNPRKKKNIFSCKKKMYTMPRHATLRPPQQYTT